MSYVYILKSGSYTYRRELAGDYQAAVGFLYDELRHMQRDGGWAGSTLSLFERDGAAIRKLLIRFDGGYYEYVNPAYPPVTRPAEAPPAGLSPRPELPFNWWNGIFNAG